MPGIEPGAFHMQSERATTALHPLSIFDRKKYFFIFFYKYKKKKNSMLNSKHLNRVKKVVWVLKKQAFGQKSTYSMEIIVFCKYNE